MTRIPCWLPTPFLALACGCTPGQPSPGPAARPAEVRPDPPRPDAATPEPPKTSIGTATMLPDGTIVLDLVASSGPTRGHARVTYPPTHPKHGDVLRHLGGLRPGERKPVPPWPDTIDDARVARSVEAYLARTRGWKRAGFTFQIVGTDASGQIAVTVDPTGLPPPRHPGGGQSVALRLDPRTYEVVTELRMK